MKCSPAVIAAVSIQCVRLCADTIYYETATGENFRNRSWHAMDRREFEAKQPDEVYDSYTFERSADGSSRVHRELEVSGDWLFLLTYHYAQNGRLTKIDWEFRDEGLTRCLRTYSVERSGKFRLLSERMEDMKTGRVVKRSFYQPEITHWMTRKQLPPIKPKE